MKFSRLLTKSSILYNLLKLQFPKSKVLCVKHAMFVHTIMKVQIIAHFQYQETFDRCGMLMSLMMSWSLQSGYSSKLYKTTDMSAGCVSSTEDHQ